MSRPRLSDEWDPDDPYEEERYQKTTKEQRERERLEVFRRVYDVTCGYCGHSGHCELECPYRDPADFLKGA